MLLKTSFLFPHLVCNVEFSWFQNTEQSSEILFFSNRNAAWVSKWEEYQNYGVLINASWVFFRFFKERFLKLCRFFRCRYSQWTFRLSRRRLEDVLKTSWKRLGSQKLLGWRRLQDVLATKKIITGDICI